jgi:hypothetical protein
VKPEVCPNCGALVPDNARACPECGSDEETGWSDRAQAQRLDLPDDEFDYDEFVRDEFGEGNSGKAKRALQIKPHGLNWIWWVAGVLLVVAILWGFLRQVW